MTDADAIREALDGISSFADEVGPAYAALDALVKERDAAKKSYWTLFHDFGAATGKNQGIIDDLLVRVTELEAALRNLLDVDSWVNDFGTAEFQAAAAALAREGT